MWKTNLCNACLSQNRNLYNLGNLHEIYEILCRSIINLNYEAETFLCWECISLLKNVKNFQEKVQKAHNFLSKISNDVHCLPTCFSNLIVSETLTLDTFEDEEKQDSLHTKPKEEYIESVAIKIEPIEEHIDEKFTTQLEDQSGEELIQKGDQNCTDSKIKNETQRHKIRNYPKERNQQYMMTNQSLKWKDTVQKVQINDKELKEWLERERNSEHFQTLKNKCDICLQKLRMDDNIWKHKKECHTATKSHPYGCDICGVHYQSKPLLRLHIRRHYYSRRCSICGYECYSQLNMRYHLRKTHQRTVACAICQLTFKNTRDFYVHLRSHSAVDHYFCDQCHKRTRSLRSLETHIKKHHMTQRCEECDTTFRDHYQLSRHIKYKHTYNPSEESFCVACDKQFHNVYAYRNHLNTATVHLHEVGKKRNKEIPCPVCFKIYSKNETMMNHYRWVHTNDSKYRCEQCDKAFLNRTKYKNHMEYTHMGLQRPRNKICRFCSRGFATNQALSHHILIHTGEKPHACPHCPQRFRQKTAMHNHVKHIHEKTDDQTQDKTYVVVSYDDSTQGSQELACE